jgi:hypothetical protein
VATVNVTETPTTLDATGAAELAVTNTGGAFVYVNTQRLRPGQRKSFDTSTPLQAVTQAGQTSTVDTAVAIPAKAASASGLPGLAIAPVGYKQPVGLRAHAAFDNSLQGGETSITFRFFCPLTDPTITEILPLFGNQNVSTVGGAPDNDGVVDLTIAAAVEHSDGTLRQFTFNGGATTVTVPRAGNAVVTPDAARPIGTQVTANDKFNQPFALTGFWMRTYVQVPPTRTDTAGTTSGSPTITDPTITDADTGRIVTGTGIPTESYVGNVTAGTSFQLVDSPSAGAATKNATATGTGVTLTIKSSIPQNLGPLASLDAATAGTGANLTAPGSGAVTGGTGTGYAYGPTVVLGNGTRPRILGLASDSIFNGFSEDFRSTNWGPVARACTDLAVPFVKLARGGGTAVSFATPSTRRIRHPYTGGATDWVVQYGTNDVSLNSAGGVTALKDRLLNITYYLLSQGARRVHVATVPPRTTSTDAFATTAGQTPTSGSQVTYVAQMNQWLRTVPSPFYGCIDLAADVMSGPDSGLWLAPGGTSDGTHPSDALMRGAISTRVKNYLAALPT